MYINNYFYIHSTIGNRLIEDDNIYMTDYYTRKFKEELSSIKLDGKTALLYAIGVSVSQSEARNSGVVTVDSGVTIKELTSYSAHKYAKIFNKNNNITYMNLNSNTCASSMFSLYEAERLLKLGDVDNVIIVTEERTSAKTKSVFKESNIELALGEGFACVVLSNNGDIKVTDTKWVTHYDNNPFKVTKEGYDKVFTECDMVKLHGTGTPVNDKAEQEAFGHLLTIRYKDTIGHTQGASSLIEVCKVLGDNKAKGKVLCVASGLGSFYGSCLVWKS